jgi:hypothetical protein
VLTVLQPMVLLPDTKPLTRVRAQIVVEQDHRMPGRNAYYAESYDAMRAALADLERESGGARSGSTDARLCRHARGRLHRRLSPDADRPAAARPAIADAWIAADVHR